MLSKGLKYACATLTAVITALCCSLSARAQVNAEQVTAVGRNALYFEDYVLSIRYFNLAIEAKPYLARPYLYRAIAKLNLEDYSGAEADASLAIDRNPFIADAYEVRGVARQNLGRPADAIADYAEALALLPDNRNIMMNKALAQEDSGDNLGAIATFDALVAAWPGYDSAYVGRARSLIAASDTVGALADLCRAIEINKNQANAYALRADIEMKNGRDYSAAVADLDAALALRPTFVPFYINRAFSRYNVDDFRGAMADYDYALTLEPLNEVALFNRALLRTEVGDNDRAITDYSSVVNLDPDNIGALFNRSRLMLQRGDFNAALADINRVIDLLPDESAPLFARFEIYDRMPGARSKAIADFDRAMQIYRREQAIALASTVNPSGVNDPPTDSKIPETVAPDTEARAQEAAARRFQNLLTIDADRNALDDERRYNNPDIRGRIQDRDVAIEPQGIFVATYYESIGELARVHRSDAVDRLNRSGRLPMRLMLTNIDAAPSDSLSLQSHFASIDRLSAAMASSRITAADCFARGLEYFTLHNYSDAIDDFSSAINLVPDFSLAYAMRAACRLRLSQMASATERTDLVRMAIADLDEWIRLDPSDPFARYNKGCIILSLGDNAGAAELFSEAVNLKPDLGEAYFNRAISLLHQGRQPQAVTDLSRAGQLGLVNAYNLIKRL